MRINQIRRRSNIAEVCRFNANAFRSLSLFVEGVLPMSMRLKIRLGTFARCAVLGLAIWCLAGAAAARAQFIDFAELPCNNLNVDQTPQLEPRIVTAGHSYNATISGPYKIGGQWLENENIVCSGGVNAAISAWDWPGYPDPYGTGAGAQYIHLSDLTWVSPTLTTFNVSIDSDAPQGPVFFEIDPSNGSYLYLWSLIIQPVPPPPQPTPPNQGPNLPCPTPKFDPNNPVTPDTWIPGQTYDIMVKGTGFTVQAGSSLPSCPATTITLTVQNGSVTLSNIVVVDPNTITAKVTPANTDPAETAYVSLWGPPEFDDDDDDQSADVAAQPSGARAGVLVQEPTIQTPVASHPLVQAATEQLPAVFNSLSQPPTVQTTPLMAAVAQPPMPQAAPAPAPAITGPCTVTPPVPPKGMLCDHQTTVQILNPSITLNRIDLMDVKATGTPNGGSFNFNLSPIIGSTFAGVGYGSGSSPYSNPTNLELSEPGNPCPKAAPCQGALTDTTVQYGFQNGLPGIYSSSAQKDFRVPTFGMSCYYSAFEKDWGTPPNQCLSVSIHWKTGTVNYSGTITDPYGLKGTYCDSFIGEILLQGSATLNSGQEVQYINSTIEPVNNISAHDGTPPVKGKTVARDPVIIPQKNAPVELDQIGNVTANDRGGDITLYRLDLYMGAGKAVCSNFDNIMAVGACASPSEFCPALDIH
jgi:hypothetical protein